MERQRVLRLSGMYGPLTLTPKQLRIVQLLAEGLKNGEIAKATGNTEHVIKNHMRKIYDRTGMGNRVELALWYVAHKESL